MTRPLAVYIHWPFCLSKCPYCDFNSYVGRRQESQEWREPFLEEIDYYRNLLSDRSITSIFFGGGTPSLMSVDLVEGVIDRIIAAWRPDPDIEITLEANPNALSVERCREFQLAGINRLSLGVQSFEDTALRFLGRSHSARRAINALEAIAQVFERFSFDLIYALPDQTPEMWEKELVRACEFVKEHLSVYQLTIEPTTPFGRLHRRGLFPSSDQETTAILFELTQVFLTERGLPSYEISNHAWPGKECRHNLTYWRSGDYIGIGPGAHGRYTQDSEKWSSVNYRRPRTWRDRVAQQGQGVARRNLLTLQERVEEICFMGLRLTQGIERQRRDLDRDLLDFLDPLAVETLRQAGFLTVSQTRVTATREGRQRLNSVLEHLLANERESRDT